MQVIKNIQRNSKKYILVGIIIFLITIISVISLIVDTSSNEVIQKYLNQYGSTATIEVDTQKMKENYDNSSNPATPMMRPENLTYEEYEEYGNSEYVQEVSYEQNSMITIDDVTPLEQTDQRLQGNNKFSGGENTINPSEMFSIIGVDDLENTDYFNEENNLVLNGTYPVNTNEILISENLFDQNNLTLNETIIAHNIDQTNQAELKIVGTYEPVTTSDVGINPENTIYTNYGTLTTLDEEKSNITAKYSLTSYEDVDKFEDELYAKGLDEIYEVNNNQELLDQVIGPVEATVKLLRMLMIITFLIGGTILVILNMLILKERKYEIGVLRALGQSKKQILKGLIGEIVIVTIIAMSVAITLGTLFSGPISNSLITSTGENITNQESSMDQKGPMGGGKKFQTQINADPVTSIQTSINVKVILGIIIINLALIVLSSLISLKIITKHEPNQILRER